MIKWLCFWSLIDFLHPFFSFRRRRHHHPPGGWRWTHSTIYKYIYCAVHLHIFDYTFIWWSFVVFWLLIGFSFNFVLSLQMFCFRLYFLSNCSLCDFLFGEFVNVCVRVSVSRLAVFAHVHTQHINSRAHESIHRLVEWGARRLTWCAVSLYICFLIHD